MTEKGKIDERTDIRNSRCVEKRVTKPNLVFKKRTNRFGKRPRVKTRMYLLPTHTLPPTPSQLQPNPASTRPKPQQRTYSSSSLPSKPQPPPPPPTHQPHSQYQPSLSSHSKPQVIPLPSSNGIFARMGGGCSAPPTRARAIAPWLRVIGKGG